MPAAVVAATLREDVARTVPLALATLCSIVRGLVGQAPSPQEFLAEWGLVDEEELAEEIARESARNLEKIAAASRARKQEKNNGIINSGNTHSCGG